ncbi:ShlB/FhaC/HecB family hemolysin secretion/activation protein [Sphingomonas panacisoli]|uniref:ShlB/FhaC/HecB family hemolysin secretion/activation protein n=1 Tax=Sphingomonas panacisoli TaxID=1813879 RepID=A0A5B8LG81_9SPHN|nr:ShlB/FhaC/HecB family hemolysin secretion/activation protein [Sphingomonas panacisoli]QDZ06652.1 ShlB/FhaC/HecB family hemolysin secretion/activation protein [Sphingomonas panacisoli]
MSMLIALTAAAAIQDRGSIIDRNRIDRPPPVAAPATSKPEPRAKVDVAPPRAAVPITGIRFVGNDAPAPVARAAQRFLGKPTDRETLQDLAAALSKAYGKSKVALYTVAIPDQDFAGGVVTVSLTEGRLASAAVAGKGRYRQLRGRLAPLLGEQPLSRATFERQFRLVRAIPGLTIDPVFDDPKHDGALTLVVKPKQKHHKFALGFSNRGVDLLGTGQFDATAEFYGAAIDGDQLSFNASAARDFKQYRYASGSYAAPIGYSGLTASISGGYFETRPKNVPIVGRAKVAGAALSYPWLRSFHRSGDVSLGVDGINSDNAVLGNLVATERTRAVRLAASYADTREKRAIAVSGSVSKGLDVAGARVTAPFADATFLKVAANASAAQAIGKSGFIRLTASAQYSRDRLPAAERYTLGGADIGRAFDTAILTGDRGAGGVAELAWRPIKSDRFGQSEVYTFIDGGVLAVLPRGPGVRTDYSLASAGLGVRARYRDKAELGLEAARSIKQPLPGRDDDWRLSVAWRLSL